MINKSSANNLDLYDVAKSIEQKRDSSPDFAESSNKELLKSVIKEKHQEINAENPQNFNKDKNIFNKPDDIVLKNKDTTTYNNEDALPDYAKNISEDAKEKVEHLINLTFEKGINAGIRASKSVDPYIMDMYHDALVDKLIVKLQENNLV